MLNGGGYNHQQADVELNFVGCHLALRNKIENKNYYQSACGEFTHRNNIARQINE